MIQRDRITAIAASMVWPDGDAMLIQGRSKFLKPLEILQQKLTRNRNCALCDADRRISLRSLYAIPKTHDDCPGEIRDTQ